MPALFLPIPTDPEEAEENTAAENAAASPRTSATRKVSGPPSWRTTCSFSTIPPIVVPFQAHKPTKYARATIKKTGGPPIKACKNPSGMCAIPAIKPTATMSKNAAPMRSQKPARGQDNTCEMTGSAAGGTPAKV